MREMLFGFGDVPSDFRTGEFCADAAGEASRCNVRGAARFAESFAVAVGHRVFQLEVDEVH